MRIEETMLPSSIKKFLRPTVQNLPRLLEIPQIIPPVSDAHYFDHHSTNESDPVRSVKADSFTHHPRVYPSFMFEFFLDPKFQNPLGFRPEAGVFEEKTSDEKCVVIRADSVKKKRKKKMNKHKLRKLRKRLSRKT